MRGRMFNDDDSHKKDHYASGMFKDDDSDKKNNMRQEHKDLLLSQQLDHVLHVVGDFESTF